jgi:hypothetical protein
MVQRLGIGKDAPDMVLLRSVGPADVHGAIAAISTYAHPPGVAAHFTVLDEAAANIWLDV